MPMPNTKNTFAKEWSESLLFRCDCGSLSHLMEFWYDKRGEDIIEGLNVLMVDASRSLWDTLKDWWDRRGVWHAECIINKEDVIALRDKLNEYLLDLEKYENKSDTKNVKETP